jgi:ApaG protein
MPQNANANARADRALLIAGLVAVVSLQFGATILNEVGYKLQLQLGNLVIDNFITPLTRSSPAPPAPRPYVEMQPDEIRLLAPSAAPSEMRCGQAVQPESITSTRHVGLDGEAGVTVFVRSAYKTREENDGLYQFTYSIEVSNDGAHPVQLMSRHWVFTDENGHVEEVKGPGARGLMVKILPSTRLEYSSSTFLATPRGSMSAATGRGRTPDSQTPADLERRLTRSAEQSGQARLVPVRGAARGRRGGRRDLAGAPRGRLQRRGRPAGALTRRARRACAVRRGELGAGAAALDRRRPGAPAGRGRGRQLRAAPLRPG